MGRSTASCAISSPLFTVAPSGRRPTIAGRRRRAADWAHAGDGRSAEERDERTDRLATEEPLEIRAQGPGQSPQAVAVTMRTPGSDFELAAGFLWSEALIEDPRGVRRVTYCEDVPDDEQEWNVVTVELAAPYEPDRVARPHTPHDDETAKARATRSGS
ncbi:MAG: formate dehydrogenase accessory sulfurtransferase FdhD [Actinomycetota bacterium]